MAGVSCCGSPNKIRLSAKKRWQGYNQSKNECVMLCVRDAVNIKTPPLSESDLRVIGYSTPHKWRLRAGLAELARLEKGLVETFRARADHTEDQRTHDAVPDPAASDAADYRNARKARNAAGPADISECAPYVQWLLHENEL